MAINNITQTISTIPEAAHRGVDVQTQFVIKQEDFQDHLQGTTVGELNNLKDQVNTTVTGINDAITTINTKASEAATSASSASASASTASTKASEAATSASSASASSTKASQWADNNYNVVVEAGKYSAKHWATAAQNTVTTKVDKVTSTDNAIVRFNGTTGDIQNSGVVIDDNNNVGIGTVTPSYAIDAQNASGSSALSLTTTGVGGCNVFLQATRSGAALLGTGSGNGAFAFATGNGTGYNATERMRIDSNGNVGIGTSIPSGFGKLAVKGPIAPVSPDEISQGVFAVDNTGKVTVGGYNSSGTNYLSFTAGGGNERMRIDANGNVTQNGTSYEIKGTNPYLQFSTPAGVQKSYIQQIADDMLINVQNAGSLAIRTNNIERVKVDSAGNIGIGTTPSTNTNNGTTKRLDIGIGCELNGSAAGSCTAVLSSNADNNNATSYYKITGQPATSYGQYNGVHSWYTAPSGTADNVISWTKAMTLGSNGNLLIGTTTDNGVDRLQVNGSIQTQGSLKAHNGSQNGTSSTLTVNVPNNTAGTLCINAFYNGNQAHTWTLPYIYYTDSAKAVGTPITAGNATLLSSAVINNGGQIVVTLSHSGVSLTYSLLITN